MMKLHGLFKHYFWLATLTMLVACDSSEIGFNGKLDKRASKQQLDAISQTKQSIDEYYFGFDLRSSPQEDARQYLPFLEYLKKSTGYTFKLRFTPKDGKVVDDLGRGIVQFAAIGAASYVQAARQYHVLPIVHGVNKLGKAEYRSMMVVRRDSTLRKLSELRGRRFAFGSITSTQGHLIPRIILAQQGISLPDLSKYEYTGSHQKCAEAVISGRFDVCGMQDTMAKSLAEKKLVRLLYKSAYFPSSGIAANKDVPDEILKKLKQALLDFQPNGRDASGLYSWDKTEMPNGFVSASDKDYAELRKWMNKLGFLHVKQGSTAGIK